MLATLRGSRPISLDEPEWRLVQALREIPPSPLRDRVSDLIDQLVSRVARPGCPELQADGAPCSDVHMSCDRCRRVIELLDGLRRRLAGA